MHTRKTNMNNAWQIVKYKPKCSACGQSPAQLVSVSDSAHSKFAIRLTVVRKTRWSPEICYKVTIRTTMSGTIVDSNATSVSIPTDITQHMLDLDEDDDLEVFSKVIHQLRKSCANWELCTSFFGRNFVTVCRHCINAFQLLTWQIVST